MLRRTPRRRWDESAGDDPAAGLLNLFDLWMVFALAVLLTVATMTSSGVKDKSAASRRSAADQQTAAAAVVPEGKKAKLPDRLRQTDKQLSGEGQRLGTAYRLKNGDVVYVPDPAR
jgi:hypothetical protein